jgi:hypothetical protein
MIIRLVFIALIAVSCSSENSQYNKKEITDVKTRSEEKMELQDSIFLNLIWEKTLSIKDSLNGYTRYDSQKKNDELEFAKISEEIGSIYPEIVFLKKNRITLKNNLYGSNNMGKPSYNLCTYSLEENGQVKEPLKYGIEICDFSGSESMILSLDFNGEQFLLKHSFETKKVMYGKVIDNNLQTVSVDEIDSDFSIYRSYFIRIYDESIVLMNTEVNDVYIFDCNSPSVTKLKLPHSQKYIGNFARDNFVVYDEYNNCFLIKDSFGVDISKIIRPLEGVCTHSCQFYYSSSDNVLVSGCFDLESLSFRLIAWDLSSQNKSE